MSVEVTIGESTFAIPAKFYHTLAKLQTVVKDFCLEARVGAVKCIFNSEYLKVEDSEDGEGKEESASEVEELLVVYMKIDKAEYNFEGEEFWEQFTSAKVKQSKSMKKFAKFVFKDQGSGITVRRTSAKSEKTGKSESTTVLEVYNASEKNPYLSMRVDGKSLEPVALHGNLCRIISFL